MRAILAGTRCVYPASVHDPLSARIAEETGFELGMLAGSTASLAILGAPDLALITLTEFSEQARRITRSVKTLPILVDADHGYGNALNVQRTVEELETAGIAALTIEDTELPAAYGAKGTRLISIEEGVGKMRAALAARDDSSLVVIGRTSAPSITGIDDTIARCRAYERAGVDALFLSGIAGRADLEKFCACVRLPVLLGALPSSLQDRDYLAGLGVRVGLQGHLPIRAAIEALHKAMTALRDDRPTGEVGALASTATMARLTCEPDYRRLTEDFLNV